MKFIIADLSGSAIDVMYSDLLNNDNYVIIDKWNIHGNNFLNKIARLNLALKSNKSVSMPLKSFYYKKLFGRFNKTDCLCFYLGVGWFDKKLFKFIKSTYPNAKIVFNFHDTVEAKIKAIPQLDVKFIKDYSDLVITYAVEDAKKYNFYYCPDMYSKLAKNKILKYPEYDVVFIGVAKDRLPKIIKAYEIFKKAGKKCYFYIVGAKDEEKKYDDEIIYSDKYISFQEVVSRQISAKALLEITQKGTKEATLRFWDAVMYNKLLFTDCIAVKNYSYYNKQYIDCFDYVDNINVKILEVEQNAINYNYNGDISPINIFKEIEKIIN